MRCRVRSALSAFLLLGALAAAPAQAAQLFGDDFESGNLSHWSTVRTGATGTATVQSSVVRAGTYAARLAGTSASGSYAYARETFASPQTDLTAGGDFRVQTEGASGGNVPLIRLYDGAGTRLLSMYRQNQSADRLYVQHSGGYYSTSGNLPLNTWRALQVSVRVAGAQAGSVSVTVDGAVVYQTSVANLGTGGVVSAQIGNDTTQQTFDVAVDNFAASTTDSTATTPLPGACDPTVPAPSNADPGTTILADNFEINDFSLWTKVVQEGDAWAHVETDDVHSGGCAGRVHVTASSTSRANIVKTLPQPAREVWADGWFSIERQGADTKSNVPTFRFFSAGKRVLDVSRQNDSGSLFVRYPNTSGGLTITQTGATLALNRWYQLKIHAVPNGLNSAVEVWLDGTLVYRTTAATLQTSSIDSGQVGAEHVQQDGDFAVDDVVLKEVTG